MSGGRSLKIAVIALAFGAVYPVWKRAFREPPAAVEAPVAKRARGVTRAEPAPVFPPDDAEEAASSGEDDEMLTPDQQAEIEAGLAYIEQIRALPGAAPLVDDIVAYLKSAPESAFSLGNLPVDEHGFAKIDAGSSEQMIKDPEIRAKWDKLMDLVAQQGTKPLPVP